MPKGTVQKRYTGEFKQKAVEYMLEHKLSYNEAEKLFEVSGQDRMRSWERIYLEEGAEGLYIERRGRSRKSDNENKGRSRKLDKKIEEDLIAEVQRLRMENDYLKKLNALVQERQFQERKRK